MLSLLKPFGLEAPAGVDPRKDTSPLSSYFRLRDARADARASERGSDRDGEIAKAEHHWRIVEENARHILTETGKDLEVAAWMTEAALRLRGLAGLTAGAQLMSGLVSGFWSQGLFPSGDDGDDSGRGISLAGLNGVSGDGTLLQPLRMVVLFYRPDQTAITLWDYERAEDVEAIGDAVRKQRRLAAGLPRLSELEDEARITGQAYLRALGEDAKVALAWWRELTNAMDRALGDDSPPSSRVAKILEKIIRVATKLAPGEIEDAVDAGELHSAGLGASLYHVDVSDHAESPDAARSGPKNPVTRDDMLQTLLVVADFFRTHEPHSPLAYTLEEAVRRARLSLPELLLEVVPDVGARSSILSQLGIRMPQD